jgi:hypothetical protein
MIGFTVSKRLLGISLAKLFRMELEDSFAIAPERGFTVVADGVTRDCNNNEAAFLGIRRPIKSATTVMHYPRPSPARVAAEISTSVIREVLTASERMDEGILRQAAMAANRSLQSYGRQIGITQESCDFLEHDYPGCALSIAALDSSNGHSTVSWGFIGDCSAAVFGADGFLVADQRTPEEAFGQHKPHVARLIDQRVIVEGYDRPTWETPRLRQIVRGDYRNNPAEPLSFGALTGESWDKIRPFFKTGTWEVNSGDIVITCSDGIGEILFDPDKASDIAGFLSSRDFSGLRAFLRRHVKSEGTLCLQAV